MSNIIYTYSNSTLPSNPSDGVEDNLSFGDIEMAKKRLEAQEQLLLNKSLTSNDPDSLIKAQNFLQSIVEREKGDKKSLLINPNRWDDTQGFKRKKLRINPRTLRQMAKTPIIKSIIGTRQAQVSAFSTPQSNKYDTGFVIRRKKSYYGEEEEKERAGDKKKIKYLTEFLLNGGTVDNKWHSDSFDTFLKKLAGDSLELDQACFELIPNRKGELVEYLAVDGGTMYLADSIDDDADDEDFRNREQIKGYYPSYVQVIEEQIVAEFYPWELCFGIRNESTDIDQNGYGTSEIEQLIKIITWMLYSDTYNGKFFSQGSSPKGILKVNSGVNRNRLAEFRQSWQSMVAGVDNAWKIPVLENDSVEWVDLQKNNTDMQFAQWQEYLIKITCAIFKIAPEEIGFNLGNASQNNPMFEGSNEASLKYSKDKGLKPLLKSIQTWINKYIISRLDDEFEFVFMGLDADTEEKEVDLDIKRVGSFMGWKEVRRKYNLPDDLDEGDFILNPQFIQMMSQLRQEEQYGDTSAGNTDFVEEDGEDTSFWDSLGEQDFDSEEQEEFVKGSMMNLPPEYRNPMMADAFKMLLSDS